jgi:hypothetical protein
MNYVLEETFTIQSNRQVTLTFLDWLALCASDKVQSFIKNLEQEALLDSFIQQEPKVRLTKSDTSTPALIFQKEEESPEKIPALVSETLAQVYREQKKFHLAIQTYQALRLHNPDKKAYFARLIREIEKEKEKI